MINCLMCSDIDMLTFCRINFIFYFEKTLLLGWTMEELPSMMLGFVIGTHGAYDGPSCL